MCSSFLHLGVLVCGISCNLGGSAEARGQPPSISSWKAVLSVSTALRFGLKCEQRRSRGLAD